jgi:hypothetical protein
VFARFAVQFPVTRLGLFAVGQKDKERGMMTMKTKLAVCGVLAAGLLAVSGPAWAHHGTVSFDMSKQVEMKATVTQLMWINPHCILKFDVTDDDGKVVHWAAEFGSPEASMQEGWTRDTLHPGDKITAYVAVSKAGTPYGELVSAKLPDGKMIHAK